MGFSICILTGKLYPSLYVVLAQQVANKACLIQEEYSCGKQISKNKLHALMFTVRNVDVQTMNAMPFLPFFRLFTWK